MRALHRPHKNWDDSFRLSTKLVKIASGLRFRKNPVTSVGTHSRIQQRKHKREVFDNDHTDLEHSSKALRRIFISAVRLHKLLPSRGIPLNQPITISTPSFTFPMPKWIENCVRFKLPLNINSSNIEICLPSPSSFRNTLVLITSPFKNIYFWIWLIYSFSSNGFKRFDSVILPQPFSQIYSFLLGSTELAAAIKSEILSRIHGNAALSWFFFFYGPELLPGGHNFFESLQYYDDWIETYKLGLLLLPELWGLLNRVLYFCLQLVNLIPKVIFIIALILPFTSFNFIVVRSLSPLLADLFHREFEGNFKIWESHIVEPLICWYILHYFSHEAI
ncbi:hypothetical protein TWF225_006799 [Orbilia oligospora]|nr:hypothetical protein TWF225_006799 [Orbilia oligospora]KAF3182772.1 hypothetical protein TWF751_005980 [Orbilia oligospora]KAF3242935.1 hypothetical protein TWF128_010393 [Orbilia oligospora]